MAEPTVQARAATDSDGSYSAGNVGPSGMAAGDGVSSSSAYGTQAASLGFGNLGASALGDGNGIGGGVNSAGAGFGGLGFGSGDDYASAMAGLGYSNPSALNGWTGGIGSFGSGATSTSPYGGVGGFNPSTASGEAQDFGGLGGFDPNALSQNITSSPFAGYGAQGAISDALGLGNVRGFGTFGSTTADNGVTGWASGSPTTMSSDGYNPGVAGAPASIASNDFTPGDVGVVSPSLVGTPSAPGFGQFGEADAGLGSAWGQAAPAGFGGIGQSLGYTAPSSAGVAGFGGFAAPSASADPAAVGDTPALTVHGPASASGAVTGDDPPSSLSTPQDVRNYALMDMAKNFGADYGSQYGLPSNFSFSDPARVAAVMSGAMGQESSFNPAAVNTSSLAAGLAQDLGAGMYNRNHIGSYDGLASDPSADRESAVLGAIASSSGADPASLDPRAVGIDAATAALSNLPGAYNNQEAFSLGQLATNPMYRASLDAVSDPTRSIKSAENTYTSNFEGPQAGINQATRDAIANATYSSINNQIASLGLSSPSVTAGTPGTGYASASPSTTTQDDVRSALGLAAGDFTPAAMAGYQNGTFSDLSLANPAASSGEDSMAPSDLKTEMAKWNSPSQAMAEAAKMDAALTGTSPWSTQGLSLDTGMGDFIANHYFNNPASPLAGVNDEAFQQQEAMALTPVSQPYFTVNQMASNPRNGDQFSYNAGDVSAEPVTISPVMAPGTLTPGLPVVGTTPTYMPGQKLGLKVAGGVLGSAVAGPLGALAGSAAAGWALDHSSPGSVSPAGGQGGNSPGTATQSGAPPSMYGTGASSSGGSASTSSASTSSTMDPNALATAAYNAAVAHQLKGPAAKVANPVSLIPPTATPARPVYNPMADPAVLAALRSAYGYR